MAVDLLSGNVWICGSLNEIYIVNGNTLVDTISLGADTASGISYISDAGNERMVVSFRTNNDVQTYNLDGTTDTVIYSAASPVGAVLYSTVYNMIFCSLGNNNGVDVIKTDGTLYNQITGTNVGGTVLMEDTKNNLILEINTAGTTFPSYINYYTLGDDGTAELEATLENEIPDQDIVIRTQPDDNCITQDEVDQIETGALEMCATCCE
jgi:hypothetical protein